jgi:UDP-sulfoquinovose synthase
LYCAGRRPPAEAHSRVRIFNQMTETHRVGDLAKLVARLSGAEIDYLANPRNEAAESDLVVDNRQLLDLGLDPITLDEGVLHEISEIAERYKERCDPARIPARSLWNRREAGRRDRGQR